MQELEVAGEKKSSLEERLSKREDLYAELQAKLDELKVSQIFLLKGLISVNFVVYLLQADLMAIPSRYS